MLKGSIISILALLLVLPLAAQEGEAYYRRYYGRGYSGVSIEITPAGDSLQVIHMLPIPVFNKKRDLRRHQRLIANLKKVYPIAKEANRLLLLTEEQMAGVESKRLRNRYMKAFEEELKRVYTPVIRNMTYSQGKLLIKLIDRQTSHTTYELVRELRGSFSAFFWQGVARLFTANLKAEYDAAGDDALVEQLIQLYEAGML